MKGLPTTIHPNERKVAFSYIPADLIVRMGGKPIAVKRKGAEPGVLIAYKNGRKVYRKNSDYSHITPIKYKK
jgi:hypothetical protein